MGNPFISICKNLRYSYPSIHGRVWINLIKWFDLPSIFTHINYSTNVPGQLRPLNMYKTVEKPNGQGSRDFFHRKCLVSIAVFRRKIVPFSVIIFFYYLFSSHTSNCYSNFSTKNPRKCNPNTNVLVSFWNICLQLFSWENNF